MNSCGTCILLDHSYLLIFFLRGLDRKSHVGVPKFHFFLSRTHSWFDKELYNSSAGVLMHWRCRWLPLLTIRNCCNWVQGSTKKYLLSLWRGKCFLSGNVRRNRRVPHHKVVYSSVFGFNYNFISNYDVVSLSIAPLKSLWHCRRAPTSFFWLLLLNLYSLSSV